MKTFDESSEQHVNVGKECRGKGMTFLEQNSPRATISVRIKVNAFTFSCCVYSSELPFPNKMHIFQRVCSVL